MLTPSPLRTAPESKMMLIVRHGLIAACIVATLSGAACGNNQPEPFIDPSGKDTTLTNLGEGYIPPTGQATSTPTRKTATSHGMQYWISVPKGWPGNRTWPVVMNISGASKDFEASAKLFAGARDANNFPYILVTPVLLTNAGDGAVPRTHPAYNYPAATWDYIDQVGRCDFDINGMAAVMSEVRSLYSGQSKAFLTGFSGGGNSTWAMVLLRPELLRAAAPVASNYGGRCITSETKTPGLISSAPERVLLPIRTFNGSTDDFLPFGTVQQQAAMDLARAHGYTNFSTTLVQGVGHDPMAVLVMNYFYSLLSASER